jgi:hypothetical protein
MDRDVQMNSGLRPASGTERQAAGPEEPVVLRPSSGGVTTLIHYYPPIAKKGFTQL